MTTEAVPSISELLRQYGNTPEDIEKLLPQLIPAIEKKKTISLKTPKFFTQQDLEAVGITDFTLDTGWVMKYLPETETVSYISPTGEEVSREDIFVNPETGSWVTRQEVEQAAAEEPEVLGEPTEFTLSEKELAGLEKRISEMGFTITSRAVMDLLKSAQTNPQWFIQQIHRTGRNPDTEKILGLLNLSQEQINAIFTTRTLEDLVQNVFPGLSGPRMMEFLDKDPETFVGEVIERGWNRDTEELLSALFPDITTEDLEEIFGTSASEAQYRNLTLEQQRTKQRWEAVETPQWTKAMTAGVGDIISAGAGVLGWLGAEDLYEGYSEWAQTLQAAAPPYELGDFNWGDLLNVEFWTERVTRAVPFTLSLVPVMVGGWMAGSTIAAATGIGRIGTYLLASFASGALSRVSESALEAGGAYNDAITQGLSDEEASKQAREVFTKNLTMAGWDAAQIAIALAPTPKFIPMRLINAGLVRTATIAGKMVIVGLSEGGEEIYQEIIQKQARGEEIKWDATLKEVFAIGATFGIGMGLGGDVVSQVMNRTKENLSTQDKARLEEATEQLENQGIPSEQAEAQALEQLTEVSPDAQEQFIAATKAVKQERLDTKTFEEARIRAEEITRPAMPVSAQEEIFTQAGTGQPGLSTETIGLVYRNEAGEPIVVVALNATPEGARIGAVVSRAPNIRATKTIIEELRRINAILPEEFEMSQQGYEIAQKYKKLVGQPTVEAEIASWERYKTEKEAELVNLTGEARTAAEEELRAIDVTLNSLRQRAARQKATGSAVPAQPAEAYRGREAEEQAGKARERTSQLREELSKAPTPAEPSVQEQEEGLATTGQAYLTPKQVAKTVELFGQYLTDPSAENAWNLTRQLRRKTLSQRIARFRARVQELIIEGISTEEAIGQARQETLSGEYPIARTNYLDDLTDEMRDALYARIYQVLKDEPLELVSTAEALTNALLGRPIPRELGVRGGSAYTRLLKVFGPSITGMEGKTLIGVSENLYEQTGSVSIPADEQTADTLSKLGIDPKNVIDLYIGDPRTPAELAFAKKRLELDVALAKGEIDLDAYKLELAIAKEKIEPAAPVTRPDLPEKEGFEGQIPLLPRQTQNILIRFLKGLGLTVIDIGNFLRANKASVDMSFWRQVAPLIFANKRAFLNANIEGFKGMFSQRSADAQWSRITRNPLYQIYEKCAEAGYDFLRPLTLEKGTSQWRGVEEYGYLTKERLIPRLTEKIPWINMSQRSFVSAINSMTWFIFKQHYQAMLRVQEQIASGRIKLKVNEVFSVEKEMIAEAELLSLLSGRASLGKAAPLAPAIGSLLFAPRLALARLLTPKLLISSNPRVRAQAWTNLTTFIGGFGGILLLGAMLGLWSVEKDPRNAEFMSIRIGNTRIDPWGGYRQYVTFFTRVITRTGISSVTGEEYEVNPLDALTHFIQGKASPLASVFTDFWTGKTFIGDEVDIKNAKQWFERLAPFALMDIYEAWQSEPESAYWAGPLAFFGFGVQTYTGGWNENINRLGLPKYPENLNYGITEPIYDVKDFWADTASQFTGVDPATLTEQKGFPPIIRSIAEALQVKEAIEFLPNTSLISINADPAKGATFLDYYSMWQERLRIAASGDEEALKKFDQDERTSKAYLGNITQNQLSLLTQYWSLPEYQRADFLKSHPELEENPREEWLKSHPKENAQLAIWGQAKVYTQEAYNIAQKLITELGIPEAAVSEYLPDKEYAEDYFKYLDLVEKFGTNGAEVRLFGAEHPELFEWLDREPVTDNLNVLKLKVEYREQFDIYDSLDAEEREGYLEANPEFNLARYKIDAYNINFPENLIDTYADWYVNQPTKEDDPWYQGHPNEVFYGDDWWLLEHPDFYQAMVDLGLWTPRDFSKVPTKEVFTQYKFYLALPKGQARLDYRETHPELDNWLLAVGKVSRLVS